MISKNCEVCGKEILHGEEFSYEMNGKRHFFCSDQCATKHIDECILRLMNERDVLLSKREYFA